MEKVNKLVLYTDATRELVELRDFIYEDWHITDDETIPDASDKNDGSWNSFIYLFDEARSLYFKKFQENINFSNEEMEEYCRIYVSRYSEWKKENIKTT